MTKENQKILDLLRLHYSNAKTVLTYSNSWELLVAVILSAQCTDVKVNEVTGKLFPKYQKLTLKNQKYNSQFKTITPLLQEIINFALIERSELGQDIRSTGFYNNKAKSVQEAAKVVLEKFNGQIPKTMAEMLTIPGVARKTANVVLGNAFGIVEGIAVDTHVKKQSQRFGFTKNTNPDKIEQDLMKEFDKKDWFTLTYLLIEHGRTIRFKKNTDCAVCKGSCKLEALAIHPAQ